MKWRRETHTFSWWFWEEMKQQWSTKGVTRSVWVRYSWERKWIVTKVRGKTEKDIKNCPYCAKHAFFATEVSCQKVVSFTHQNTLSQKFKKNLPSVFRDWKSYSQGSRELSRENLCVSLATGASTRKQVAKTDPRERDCDIRLVWPATESPKQGNTIFENFQFL